MNIEEAIQHCHEVADAEDCQMMCAADHRWLADRLEELKELKEATRWRDCREEPPVNQDLVITITDDEYAPEDFVGRYSPKYKEWHNAFGIRFSPRWWLPIPEKGGEA